MAAGQASRRALLDLRQATAALGAPVQDMLPEVHGLPTPEQELQAVAAGRERQTTKENMKTLLSLALLAGLLTACQGVKPELPCAKYHQLGAESAEAKTWFDEHSQHRSMGTQTSFQFWVCEGCGKIVAAEVFEPVAGGEPISRLFFRP